MLKDPETYSTDHLSGKTTVEAWRRHLQFVYYGHEVSVPDDGAIHGHLKKRAIDDIALCSHRANAHAIARTATLVKQDYVEKHGLIMPTSGTLQVSQAGRTTVAKAGQLYILNASEPFEVVTPDGASSVGIIVPSGVCRTAIRGLDDKFCDATIGEGFLIRTLAFAIQDLLTSETDVDPVWLRDFVLTLVDAAIAPRRSKGPPDLAAPEAASRALVVRLRDTVARKLGDIDFGIEDAAAACRVSVRHLQSVLRAADTSFTQELTEARLEHAHDLLQSCTSSRAPIKQIAARCGFRSQAYFATSYRKRFGVTPSDDLYAKVS